MKVFNKKFVAHLKPDILIPGGIEVLSHGLSPIEKWPVLGPYFLAKPTAFKCSDQSDFVAI